jgi:hypothetical protein
VRNVQPGAIARNPTVTCDFDIVSVRVPRDERQQVEVLLQRCHDEGIQVKALIS